MLSIALLRLDDQKQPSLYGTIANTKTVKDRLRTFLFTVSALINFVVVEHADIAIVLAKIAAKIRLSGALLGLTDEVFWPQKPMNLSRYWATVRRFAAERL